LLNYVVLMALWKIDVNLIITLVNKSIYHHYYYYYYRQAYTITLRIIIVRMYFSVDYASGVL